MKKQSFPYAHVLLVFDDTFKPIKTTSIHRWYVAGALFSPKGILTN